MFTSGFPNIYGAEQLRGKLEEFALVPESGADWSAAPNQ
jgi:iron complex transport system substrate-binding protein